MDEHAWQEPKRSSEEQKPVEIEDVQLIDSNFEEIEVTPAHNAELDVFNSVLLPDVSPGDPSKLIGERLDSEEDYISE